MLRHLAACFGRRLTVPEQKLRELEEGVMLPIMDSVEIERKKIYFWYKNPKDVVLHRLNLDMKQYGDAFFMQFDCIDVVIGEDHGQRKFRMVMGLIF
jgi:hypothetical protein